MSSLHNERKVVVATQALALLNEQADELRAELAALRQDVAEAQRRLNGMRGPELQEANEQLLLAALHAETVAETAVSNLDSLARSSQRDPLTDTPNRALMLDRLESAIAMARRHGTRVAVLFLDVDHFKQINDTLGHAVGDEVLQRVARRLESVVRESDTVSRYGGDEFVVLLSDVTQASDAALIAAKMLSALAGPSRMGDDALRLYASIGITVYPEDGEHAATLISRADAAMYRSKKRGPGSFEFHRADISGDGSLAPTAVDALRQPPARFEFAQAEHEPRLRNLREANEQLVIAAVNAQELEVHAETEHRRQINFLAMVAHELRNPLTPIQTAAELLDRARPDEPRLARLQAVIKRQVAHLSRLVDDLLDGARVSTGKFRLERSNVELADIIGLAAETCRPAMDTRLQHLLITLPPRALRVHGDPVRLAQIFSNLLDNASKYTQEGGEIALEATALDHSAVIKVSDNGIGISAEALPYIFDLFVQDTHALARRNGGLGIGLAVVRDLVVGHGGTVLATSAGMDLGSEFVVTLPMTDAATL